MFKGAPSRGLDVYYVGAWRAGVATCLVLHGADLPAWHCIACERSVFTMFYLYLRTVVLLTEPHPLVPNGFKLWRGLLTRLRGTK